MFDYQKAQQLQNKSHVRGKLNKQFFWGEQEELERKRREMKSILDQQVEERRRQKQREKYEYEMKIKKQEDQIRAYYAQIEGRQKKPVANMPNNSINSSNAPKQSAINYPQSGRLASGVYESKVSLNERHQRNSDRFRSNSRNVLDPSDIPVMPVMQQSSPRNSDKNRPYNSSATVQPMKNHTYHRNSSGNIPLLQLSPDQHVRMKNDRKKSKGKSKQHSVVDEDFQRKRRQTVADQDSLPGSRQHTELKEVFGDLNEQLQNENRDLKEQLKKNQEAISLLIGAVRSNSKLDKFRVQAQKILHGQHKTNPQITSNIQSRVRKPSTRGGEKQKQKQKDLILPKLKLKHQSIMHDYIFGSAKKAQEIKAKTLK